MSDVNVTVEQRDGCSGRLVRPIVRVSNRLLPRGLKAAAYLLAGQDEADDANWPASSDPDPNSNRHGFGLAPYYIAIGTDGTPASDRDETLGAEIFRNVITRRSNVENYPSRVRYQLQVLTGQANGYTIQEVGLFLPPDRKRVILMPITFQIGTLGVLPLNRGIMFARAVIPEFAKTETDTLTITFDYQIANVE